MTPKLFLTSLVSATCLLTLFSDCLSADERADALLAKQFWKTLAMGDMDATKAFYAPQVVLKSGSELLKKQWGVSKDGDRSKDLLVGRDDLLQGYRRLIDQVGKEKWTQIFNGIDQEKIRVFTADKKDQPIPGAERGDTVLQIATGPGDDTLQFILRKDADGKLLVYLEATDY